MRIAGNSNVVITNSEFVGNTALFGGGVEDFSLFSSRIVNTTFVGNAANNGAAMLLRGGDSKARNCVVWGNQSINDDGLNVIGGDGDEVEYCLVEGGFEGANNIGADPMFVDELGPDMTAGTGDEDLRLTAGSPAIDSGDSASLLGGSQLFDLDGLGRRADDPATPDTGTGRPNVDMGAYEFNAISPCSQADFALPFGRLDFNDVVVFIQLFGSGSFDANLNDDDSLDSQDVVAFLTLFGAGCP